MAIGEEADPAKREVPAKQIPVEKVEPRARVLERPAAPPIITGAVPETPSPVSVMTMPERAPRVAVVPPPEPRRRPVLSAPRKRLAAPIMPPAAFPDSLPAVDGANATGAGFGGAFDGRALYGGMGSLTVPFGMQYGVQLDGMVQGLDTRFARRRGAAGRVFWRDPAQGLIGLYGHYAHMDVFGGVDLYAGGMAGALYLGRWSLDGVAGVEGGGSATGTVAGVPMRLDVATRFFDIAMLSFYPGDNLKVSAGHAYTGGRHALDLGAEWAFATAAGTAAALFAQGSFVEGGDAGVIGGVRLYLGQHAKPLIVRHREDTHALAPPAARPWVPIDTLRPR